MHQDLEQLQLQQTLPLLGVRQQTHHLLRGLQLLQVKFVFTPLITTLVPTAIPRSKLEMLEE
jgi:hypothetical protein